MFNCIWVVGRRQISRRSKFKSGSEGGQILQEVKVPVWLKRKGRSSEDEDEVAIEHEIVQRRRGVQVNKGGQSPDEVSQTLLFWEGDY